MGFFSTSASYPDGILQVERHWWFFYALFSWILPATKAPSFLLRSAWWQLWDMNFDANWMAAPVVCCRCPQVTSRWWERLQTLPLKGTWHLIASMIARARAIYVCELHEYSPFGGNRTSCSAFWWSKSIAQTIHGDWRSVAWHEHPNDPKWPQMTW